MSVTCRGVTQSDVPCKRTVKKGAGKYCYQHKSQATPTPVTTVKGLPPSRSVLPQRCVTTLKRGPTQKDGPGHIYVYSLLRDEKEPDSYWKIGRTTQTVQQRLSQWHGSQLKSSYTVKYNKLAEKLIHQLLSDVRIYRYKYTEGSNGTAERHHSIWKSDGKPIMDSQNRVADIESGTWKLSAAQKHVEWFVCDWKTTKQVIEAIIAHVNKL